MYLQYKSSFIFFLVLAFAISLGATAQTEPGTLTAKKAVYFEFGGSSGRYAVNYSKIFHQKGKLKLSASAGFSMWRHEKLDSRTTWLPTVPFGDDSLLRKVKSSPGNGNWVYPLLRHKLRFSFGNDWV
ncbi:hypothetical protein SAMN04488104_10792 [Algoriphagus faecimaris]|uniref:Uncharacterized protein n=1 Tax=Algoriphagus faecimaris TaxID=686796 RepID=A0A1G6Y5A3_9BACT|nr:hypothetical protein [Algoriphagus faecimaris]SDD84877.1 hypothetical protein SAMN04488104_10792 [Algoriphagus faecimaris]